MRGVPFVDVVGGVLRPAALLLDIVFEERQVLLHLPHRAEGVHAVYEVADVLHVVRDDELLHLSSRVVDGGRGLPCGIVFVAEAFHL